MTQAIFRSVGACVALFAAFGGHAIETAPQAGEDVRIDVAAFPRPVAAAVFQVERHFGRPVTYEDGSYVAQADIVDDTALVRKDGTTTPRVLGRRLDSISLVHKPAGPSVDARVGNTLSALLAKWNGPSHSGTFRVERANGGYHVIPVERRGVGGQSEPYASPLDTRITIAREERGVREAIAVVTKAIADESGRDLTPSVRIPKDLPDARIAVGAEGEVARGVLWNVLQSIGPGLSWQLLCDVGEDSPCTLNIYQVTGGA